jgi:alanine racemase
LEDAWFTDCRISLLMSHLACASERHHPLNAQQLETMQRIARRHDIPVSLTNSGGIFLSDDFHFHLARPGCSLYGVAPEEGTPNPMHQVAHWQAPILQTRLTTHEQSVGYGATKIVPKGTHVVTVASGYADGYHRILSNHSCAYIGEHRMPLLGRVTMDMLCFDGTDVPESLLHEGAMVSLLGKQEEITVDGLAARAQTIGYEILTSIGPRVKRIYVEEPV